MAFPHLSGPFLSFPLISPLGHVYAAHVEDHLTVGGWSVKRMKHGKPIDVGTLNGP